jgi:hypothetical protein
MSWNIQEPAPATWSQPADPAADWADQATPAGSWADQAGPQNYWHLASLEFTEWDYLLGGTTWDDRRTVWDFVPVPIDQWDTLPNE